MELNEVGQLRNLRDFLMVYNRMTEICFQRCTSNFNYRSLTLNEERCVDSCAGKLIRSNHRLMGTYVQLMPKMVQRRMDEMEAKAAENAKAAEAAAPAPALGEELGGGAAASVPPAAESSPAPQIPIITPSPSSETPALISPSVTDVGLVQLADATGQLAHMPEVSPPSSFVLGEATVIPEVAGPLLTSTPLDVSIELGPVGSASTTAVQPVTESKMAVATLLTPVMDTVNHSALTRENVTAPGVTAFLPLETPPNVTKLPPLLGRVQIESGSSVPPASVQPTLTLPTPVASPVSTIAVPIMSKATESVTVTERPQEVPPAADK